MSNLTERLSICIVFGLMTMLGPGMARAETESSSETEMLNRWVEYANKINEVASNRVSLGYDMGIFGTGWAQGLRLQVPFSKYWGLRLRPIWFHGPMGPAAVEDPYDPSAVGRLDLYGSSPVFLGLVRLYGGGGPQFGVRPLYDDASRGDQFVLGLGGFFGFEFFASSSYSAFIEIGGQSSMHGRDLGDTASVIAGFNLYL